MTKFLGKFQRYGDTQIYAYWERMRMPESHTCIVCDKRLNVRSLVEVAPYLDEEDGGATCIDCGHCGCRDYSDIVGAYVRVECYGGCDNFPTAQG